MECPSCTIESDEEELVLGTTGLVVHYRCRYCRHTWSEIATADIVFERDYDVDWEVTVGGTVRVRATSPAEAKELAEEEIVVREFDEVVESLDLTVTPLGQSMRPYWDEQPEGNSLNQYLLF